MKTIPLSAARTLHLMAQGLLAPPRRKATKAAVLDAIRRKDAAAAGAAMRAHLENALERMFGS